ncbi:MULTISPECIES: hypothetical protein [Flavobacteriaceae]|uniref:hypothetical protein n=1 Tax=Flavobacteriaceae TaxID=49546 RepID=UPI001491D250|nr:MULTISPECIES: hypothetical protein [Allomuricauda]MDC6367246.1 hypothetical protein [Muricauda sp. AC10]
MKKLIGFFLFCTLVSPIWGQTKKMTSFKPELHGFKFDNSFKNIFIDAIDWRTGGLCGGMSYSALDYYYARGISTPKTTIRPTEGSPLQKYLYDRQVTSLTSNLDKWAEIGFNIEGARNSEFFNWGVENKKGSRINELRSFINRRQPVPLGLQSVGEKESDPGNHQVLAIGYDFGTAQDLANGAYKRKMKIYTYDPNYPNKIMTLIPNFKDEVFYYEKEPHMRWRTYFVDKKYRAKTPLRTSLKDYPNDGNIHELVFEFGVGKDDLRGGNDNLNLTIFYHNGTQQRVYNVNKGNKWIDDYSQYITIPLRKPVPLNAIKSVQLNTISGNDNFNLDVLRIHVKGFNRNRKVYDKRGAPLKRFTGKDKTFLAVINSRPPQTRSIATGATTSMPTKAETVPSTKPIDKLRFRIRTGDDDLRGGNDNLNIVIHYKSGRRQTVKNVNKGTRWKDNTTVSLDVELNYPVNSISEISQVVLQTTFKGGMGGDNWNLNYLHIETFKGNQSSGDFCKKGSNDQRLYRFTDKSNSFVVKR